MNETNNKEEYLNAWNSHIDTLYILGLVHSEELSKEIRETLDKLKKLVVRVARDKGLK